jgi:hypothetical protein
VLSALVKSRIIDLAWLQDLIQRFIEENIKDGMNDADDIRDAFDKLLQGLSDA